MPAFTIYPNTKGRQFTSGKMFAVCSLSDILSTVYEILALRAFSYSVAFTLEGGEIPAVLCRYDHEHDPVILLCQQKHLSTISRQR